MKMKKIIKNTLISSRPFRFLSRFPNYLWLAFISLVIIISACDNPDLNNFKTPLVVDTFGTKSVDTFSFIVRTKLMDSIPSYSFTKDLIGCYNDLIVGKVVASAYVSFRLPSYSVKFPANTIHDSAVLTIRYSGVNDYFGNILEPQTFRIFEVTEKLKYDSHYYSTSKPAINQLPIGEWTGFLRPQDTLLNFKLTKEFSDKLLAATDDQLSTNDKFIDFFRGIAIVPDGQVLQGAIVYFLLNNSKTSISLYFNDTGHVVFPVNAYSARFNNFKHDFTGSGIQTQLSQPQTEFNDVILDPMSGSMLKIKIPYLKHLIDSGFIAIHRAEITFPLDLNSPYYANAPASLLLIQTDSSNKFSSIIDHDDLNSGYYGGLLNTAKTAYSFTITRYFQQLLQQYKLNPLYIEKKTLTLIIPSDNPITASPVLLLNRDQNNKPAFKLKIWYSKM